MGEDLILDLIYAAATRALPGWATLDSGDRYGGFEKTWVRHGDDRRAFVTLAYWATGLDKADIEVWAGADSGQKYGRWRVGGLADVPTEPLGFYRLMARQVDELVTLLSRAQSEAERARPDQLTRTYLTQDFE